MSDDARNLDTYGDGYDEPEAPSGWTPGPWDWTNEGTWPDGVSIATVGEYNIIVEDGTNGDEEADARLIANAPSLLDGCQQAYVDAEKALCTVDALHPAVVILRGLRAALKHIIEDATGGDPDPRPPHDMFDDPRESWVDPL